MIDNLLICIYLKHSTKDPASLGQDPEFNLPNKIKLMWGRMENFKCVDYFQVEYFQRKNPAGTVQMTPRINRHRRSVEIEGRLWLKVIQSSTKRLAWFCNFPLNYCQGQEASPHLPICHFRKDCNHVQAFQFNCVHRILINSQCCSNSTCSSQRCIFLTKRLRESRFLAPSGHRREFYPTSYGEICTPEYMTD